VVVGAKEWFKNSGNPGALTFFGKKKRKMSTVGDKMAGLQKGRRATNENNQSAPAILQEPTYPHSAQALTRS